MLKRKEWTSSSTKGKPLHIVIFLINYKKKYLNLHFWSMRI